MDGAGVEPTNVLGCKATDCSAFYHLRPLLIVGYPILQWSLPTVTHQSIKNHSINNYGLCRVERTRTSLWANCFCHAAPDSFGRLLLLVGDQGLKPLIFTISLTLNYNELLSVVALIINLVPVIGAS